MVVLAATMLLFGGGELVGGLLALRDPRGAQCDSQRRSPAGGGRGGAQARADSRRHRRPQPGWRCARTPSRRSRSALFTLYTVAAVLSRDRNGRRLALLTATSGIAFQLAELPLKMHIAKQTVAAGGALILESFGPPARARGVPRPRSIAALDMIAALLAPGRRRLVRAAARLFRRPPRARALRDQQRPDGARRGRVVDSGHADHAVGAAIAGGVMLLLTGVRVLQEYERAVVFRFGRARKELAGPGVNLLLPFGIDRMRVVDTRTRAIQIAPQEIITHDNISISVDAVVYASVASPAHAVLEVEEFMPATLQLAATTLRAVLGKMDLDEILAHRDAINTEVREHPRHAHRAVGRRDLGGRDQGHPAAQGDAARDGAPGGGRARAARQGDRRRGRGAGGVEAGAGGRDDRRRTRARCSCGSTRRWSRCRARRRRRSCSRCRSISDRAAPAPASRPRRSRA